MNQQSDEHDYDVQAKLSQESPPEARRREEDEPEYPIRCELHREVDDPHDRLAHGVENPQQRSSPLLRDQRERRPEDEGKENHPQQVHPGGGLNRVPRYHVDEGIDAEMCRAGGLQPLRLGAVGRHQPLAHVGR